MRVSALAVVVFFLGGVNPGMAQTLPLITLQTTWRYNQTGTNLGTTWIAPDYDDSGIGWEGPGLALFGFETDEGQYASLGASFQTRFPDPQNPVTNFHTNYYLRTHFNMPNYPAAVLAATILNTTNWFDDGVVYYLNGVELLRTNMPAATITAATFALGSLTEPVEKHVSKLGTNLVVGDNVFAVELHQANLTSSDEVFGMTMTAILPSPPTILSQPAGVTNVLGATNAILSVGAAGTSPLFYQWYSNAVPIGGATSNSYLLNTATTNSGDYFVLVSNVVSVVTSATVRVVIAFDTFPPTLVAAFAGPPTRGSNQVDVFFNELLDGPAAIQLTNYSISKLGTLETIPIVVVQWNGILVRLTCSAPLEFGAYYVLTVNGVADRNGNVILPNSQIGITFSAHALLNLMPMNQSWFWDENLDDPGNAWKDIDYEVPPTWGGPAGGYFYFRPPYTSLPTFPCGSVNPTPLGGYATWAYYFRTHFQFPVGLPTAGALKFTHLVADGAIFYLNGIELFRFNIGDGPVEPWSPAYSLLGGACRNTNIVVTNMISGDNVLAVEVHPFGGSPESAIVFGTSLDFDYQPTSPLPPRLMIAESAPGHQVVTWTNVADLNWGLEFTTNLLAGRTTWEAVTNASPYTNYSTTSVFFRLHAR